MPDAPLISVEQVHKRFGAVHALKGVSLSVNRGEIFGLIGPNGAGKTTLFSLLLGYLKPSAGAVRTLGVPPHDLFKQRGKIGVLPQDADLPPTISLGQALLFFARVAGVAPEAQAAEVKRVLDLVDLGDVQGRKIRELSHGMKKRLYIAQALIGAPELVILDEPTAGLDPKHAHELGQVFKTLAARATVVISSHNLTELEHLCDRAAILVKGEVVRAGTMKEIRRAGEEAHITLARESTVDEARLAALLPDVALSYDKERQRLTLRYTPSETRSSEQITTQALQALIAQGALIYSVEHGQSLLQTYLELSTAASQ